VSRGRRRRRREGRERGRVSQKPQNCDERRLCKQNWNLQREVERREKEGEEERRRGRGGERKRVSQKLRIAMNGDFANKIGTYSVAVLAKYHGIPFHPVAPVSTLDFECACSFFVF
jgi:hypothetical protein